MTLFNFITTRTSLRAVNEVVDIEECACYFENTRDSEIDEVNLHKSVIGDPFLDCIDSWPHSIDSDKYHTCLKEVKNAPCTARNDMELDRHVLETELLVEVADDAGKYCDKDCKESEVEVDLSNIFLLRVDHSIEEVIYPL